MGRGDVVWDDDPGLLGRGVDVGVRRKCVRVVKGAYIQDADVLFHVGSVVEVDTPDGGLALGASRDILPFAALTGNGAPFHLAL